MMPSTGYQPNGLLLQLTGIRAHAPPLRALEFDIQLVSKFTDPVVVIGSGCRVSLAHSEVAHGDLLRLYTAPARGAAFGGDRELVGTIIAPLSRETLDWIESRRNGDLEYSLDVTVLVAPVVGTDPETLGRPWHQPVMDRFSNPIRAQIPQSEWLKYLRTLGWDETVLFELPVTVPRQSFPQAQARLEEAMGHFRRGDWEESMSSCRKVMEALAAARTDPTEKPNPKNLREYFEVGEKGDALNSVLYQFGQLLHLARHEHGTAITIKVTRDDALLSLMIAGAFLRYVSS
jgi:hypothetical protein